MDAFERLMTPGKKFLGVQYPLIAGAMTWISNFELVKAASEAGIFGVFAAGNIPPDVFEKDVDRLVAEIKTPFAVNLITIGQYYNEQREILKTKKVPCVVFAANSPSNDAIKEMKDSGKKTITFAPAEATADRLIRAGIDALVIEGTEAGGHIGPSTTMILLQETLLKHKSVPVFVGGGVGTGEMIAHLLLMGAAGVQMGTRFVLTEEATAHPKFKERFIRGKAREAIASPQYDERIPIVPVRALKNKGHEAFGRLQLELIQKLDAGTVTREEAQQEVEHFWIGGLRKAAIEGDIDEGSVMAGQSVGLMKDIRPMKDVVNALIDEAKTEFERVKTLIK